jgi:hypothetical protein
VASGVLMQPLGDLRGSIETIGYGGGFHFLTALGRGTVSVGVDSQLLLYSEPGAQRDDMIVTAHGLIRLHRRSAPRRPYAEALAGLKGFSVSDRFPTWSYGVGVGMQFPFGRRQEGTGERELIEVGVRYLRGGAAVVGGLRSPSSTDSIMLHIGRGWRF